MKKHIIDNFFNYNFNTEKFDVIITDPPYKNAIKNTLNEENFNVDDFFNKINLITEKEAGLIVFSNFAMSYDLRYYALKHGWKFHTYQIWNKLPIRNWIAWSFPLRHCEFILYFKKGNFKFNFKTGKIKPPVKRSSFGGSLKNTSKNTNKVSYEMYSEIIEFKNIRRTKIHPTEKPRDFSIMFKKIVGSKKVIDMFAGSGNLVAAFDNFLTIDIKNYNRVECKICEGTGQDITKNNFDCIFCEGTGFELDFDNDNKIESVDK